MQVMKPAQASPRARTTADARSSFQLVTQERDERMFLPVSTQVSYLVERRGGPALTLRRPARPVLALEPVQVEGRPRLLVLQPGAPGLQRSNGAASSKGPRAPRPRMRLNGQPLPPVAILRVRDRLRVGPRTFHVTAFRAGGAVAPAPAQLGVPCGVCRLPLTQETLVHACECGVLLHLEGEPIPVEERLECALVGDACPSCESALMLEGGHVWLPEVDA